MSAPAAVVELDGQAWALSVHWRTPTPEEARTFRCRRKITGISTCGARPAVLTVRRHGAGTSRWPYCTDHAAELGHYVIDGVVRHRPEAP